MCTYTCGAQNASVRMLCLRVHFHVEACTDKFSLELASSLVHRPNCCFFFGPQAKLECRFPPCCLEQDVFHHGCRSPVQAPRCWLTLEFGMLKNYKTIYFFNLGRLRRTELPGNWEKAFTPSKALMSSASPVPYRGVTHSTHGAAPTCKRSIFLEVALLLFVTATKSQPWRGVVICSIQTH